MVMLPSQVLICSKLLMPVFLLHHVSGTLHSMFVCICKIMRLWIIRVYGCYKIQLRFCSAVFSTNCNNNISGVHTSTLTYDQQIHWLTYLIQLSKFYRISEVIHSSKQLQIPSSLHNSYYELFYVRFLLRTINLGSNGISDIRSCIFV
jgi:hypothetical protein